MPYYKLTAEHITHKRGQAVIDYADGELGLHVLHAGPDDVFTDLFHIVIEASEDEMTQVRDRLWELNRGASCETVKDWSEEQDWAAGWL
jgi:hypothetical protein